MAQVWHRRADDTEMKSCYNTTVNQWACDQGPLLLYRKEYVEMKYCPYCGAAIPDGAVVFCVECGKELPKRLDKPEKANVDKGTPSAKQKQRKKRATADEEYRRAYNEGYDGYYEDVLPVDYGQERFETDSFPVKKVITVAVGAIVLISLCVLMLYLV